MCLITIMLKHRRRYYGFTGVIHGHHIYKGIWTAFVFVGKIQCVKQEIHNKKLLAIAIMKAETITGHVPHKVSFVIPLILSKFQLLFSGVTLPCVWVYAPISHV